MLGGCLCGGGAPVFRGRGWGSWLEFRTQPGRAIFWARDFSWGSGMVRGFMGRSAEKPWFQRLSGQGFFSRISFGRGGSGPIRRVGVPAWGGQGGETGGQPRGVGLGPWIGARSRIRRGAGVPTGWGDVFPRRVSHPPPQSLRRWIRGPGSARMWHSWQAGLGDHKEGPPPPVGGARELQGEHLPPPEVLVEADRGRADVVWGGRGPGSRPVFWWVGATVPGQDTDPQHPHRLMYGGGAQHEDFGGQDISPGGPRGRTASTLPRGRARGWGQGAGGGGQGVRRGGEPATGRTGRGDGRERGHLGTGCLQEGVIVQVFLG